MTLIDQLSLQVNVPMNLPLSLRLLPHLLVPLPGPILLSPLLSSAQLPSPPRGLGVALGPAPILSAKPGSPAPHGVQANLQATFRLISCVSQLLSRAGHCSKLSFHDVQTIFQFNVPNPHFDQFFVTGCHVHVLSRLLHLISPLSGTPIGEALLTILYRYLQRNPFTSSSLLSLAMTLNAAPYHSTIHRAFFKR